MSVKTKNGAGRLTRETDEHKLDEARHRERLFTYLTAPQWAILLELFNGATINARASKDVSAIEDLLDMVTDHPDFADRLSVASQAKKKKREAQRARWATP